MENMQKNQETDKKEDQNTQFLSDMAQAIKEEVKTKSYKKKVKGLRGRKKLMVEALISSYGIISDACRKTGVPRQTHYQWLKDDSRYKEACQHSEQVLKDLGEKALLGLLVEKNPQAVIHFNKTKNRDRGYGDYIQTEEMNNKPRKIELEIINTNIKNESPESTDKNNKGVPTSRGITQEEIDNC